MLMDQEDINELNSPSISYQNNAPDTEVPKKLFHQKTSENCDKNCEVIANSDCTPTITNISPVKLRITVKSEKDLIGPSKSVPELIQKPSNSVPELVKEPSKSVQELQKPSYNLDLDLDKMDESNIQDPDLDQINVVDQIIATRKTAQ